jgi:hypothetical protein
MCEGATTLEGKIKAYKNLLPFRNKTDEEIKTMDNRYEEIIKRLELGENHFQRSVEIRLCLVYLLCTKYKEKMKIYKRRLGTQERQAFTHC